MSVRKSHTSEIRAVHPYLKKGESPPPPNQIKTRQENVDFLAWFGEFKVRFCEIITYTKRCVNDVH